MWKKANLKQIGNFLFDILNGSIWPALDCPVVIASKFNLLALS